MLAVERVVRERELEVVDVAVDAVGLRVRRLAVGGGVEVGAAGEHERVEAVEEPARVADRVDRAPATPPARATASR